MVIKTLKILLQIKFCSTLYATSSTHQPHPLLQSFLHNNIFSASFVFRQLRRVAENAAVNIKSEYSGPLTDSIFPTDTPRCFAAKPISTLPTLPLTLKTVIALFTQRRMARRATPPQGNGGGGGGLIWLLLCKGKNTKCWIVVLDCGGM